VLTLIVPGRPVPKARARLGRGGRWYTPERTRHYERRVGYIALEARDYWESAGPARVWPKDVLYDIEVVACFYGRRTADGDNVLKSVKDGCQGILWTNDRQVRRATIEVRAVSSREEERLELRVAIAPSSKGSTVPNGGPKPKRSSAG